MRRGIRIIKSRKTILQILLLFGVMFLFGVVLMLLCKNLFLRENGILSKRTIERIREIQINEGDFFCYLLTRRVAIAGLLILLSGTVYGLFSIRIFLTVQGIAAGMFTCAAILQFGGKGLLFLLGAFFPHQFILIPTTLLLMIWCLQRFHYKRRNPVFFLWMITGFIVGCLFESYVNPIVLKEIINFI